MPNPGARMLPLWPAMLAISSILVWWNQLPLHDRSMHTRTKDLSFVPDPVLSRMLCIGQCGAASKLQWIDSFAYFELQLERRDDTLMGSHQSGFQRLYDDLIAEDPYYEPFYEYGAFNVGGLLNRHDLALGLQLRGLLMLPQDPQLWRQAAAELYTSFSYEERQPALMDDFLQAWAAAMTDQVQQRQVWDWMAAMGRRQHLGTAQLSYWQSQRELFPPDSAEGRYIEAAMREELATYCVAELQALADAYRAHAMTPALELADCLDPQLVAARYPHQLPPFGPLQLQADGTRILLRLDPYGYQFRMMGGHIISPGLQRNHLSQRLGFLRNDLDEARKQAPIPDLATAQRRLPLPELPPEAHWTWQDHTLGLAWEEPPGAPWPLPGRSAPAGR